MGSANSTSRASASSTASAAGGGLASQLQQELLGVFQAPDDRGGEAGTVGAVGHAMIEGDGEGQEQARHDLAVADDGLQPGTGHSQNGDFRVIDDRDGARATEGAEVGDGERASAEIV